jgi:hypothetical protein
VPSRRELAIDGQRHQSHEGWLNYVAQGIAPMLQIEAPLPAQLRIAIGFTGYVAAAKHERVLG